MELNFAYVYDPDETQDYICVMCCYVLQRAKLVLSDQIIYTLLIPRGKSLGIVSVWQCSSAKSSLETYKWPDKTDWSGKVNIFTQVNLNWRSLLEIFHLSASLPLLRVPPHLKHCNEKINGLGVSCVENCEDCADSVMLPKLLFFSFYSYLQLFSSISNPRCSALLSDIFWTWPELTWPHPCCIICGKHNQYSGGQ